MTFVNNKCGATFVFCAQQSFLLVFVYIAIVVRYVILMIWWLAIEMLSF